MFSTYVNSLVISLALNLLIVLSLLYLILKTYLYIIRRLSADRIASF